ncbi:MAG: hypothetical protein O7A03_07290 [Alphaproteobacteria bacterium]|nr:hypothetical protein [Alphaproteobacteria bacterium]
MVRLPQQSTLQQVALGVLLVVLLAKVAVFVALAMEAQYIMDEYWLVGDGLIFERAPYREVWPAKTLLYAAFFAIAHWLGDSANGIMTLARGQSALAALATLGVVYLIARRIGASLIEALFALVVLLSTTSFMEWGFIARPEPLALLFGALALLIVVGRDATPRSWILAGLLSGLAFLTLQKAVYFNLAVGLALCGQAVFHGPMRRAVSSGALLVAGWAAMVLAYGLVFTLQGGAYSDIMRQVVTGSIGNAIAGHLAYDDGLRGHVLLALVRNPVPFALFFAGWLVAAARLRRADRPIQVAWIFTGVIAALVYAYHPAPWPYNLTWALPFLALWAPMAVRFVVRARAELAPIAMLAVVLGLLPGFGRNFEVLQNHTNAYQRAVVAEAESLLQPEERYADGIGMIVDRRRAADQQWWAVSTVRQINADAAVGNYRILHEVLAERPKIWLLSYRTRNVARALEPLLAQSYVQIHPNILIAGRALPADGSAATFDNYWPGAYELYRADGTAAGPRKLSIDAKAVTPPVTLTQGPHLASAGGGERLFLLPVGHAGKIRVAEQAELQRLFPEPYGF